MSEHAAGSSSSSWSPEHGSERLGAVDELEPQDMFQDSLPPSDLQHTAQELATLAHTPLRPMTLSQKKRRRTATPRWNVDDSFVGADENTNPNIPSASKSAIKGGKTSHAHARAWEGSQRNPGLLNDAMTPLRIR